MPLGAQEAVLLPYYRSLSFGCPQPSDGSGNWRNPEWCVPCHGCRLFLNHRLLLRRRRNRLCRSYLPGSGSVVGRDLWGRARAFWSQPTDCCCSSSRQQPNATAGGLAAFAWVHFHHLEQHRAIVRYQGPAYSAAPRRLAKYPDCHQTKGLCHLLCLSHRTQRWLVERRKYHRHRH